MATVVTRMPAELRSAINAAAAKDKCSANSWMLAAVEAKLAAEAAADKRRGDLTSDVGARSE